MKVRYPMNAWIKTLLLLYMLAASSRPAQAAEADIGPVYLDKVAVVQAASGGHLAGNVEIKVRGGMTLPAGLVCDTSYITTLRSTDSDQRMFKLLSAAHLAGRAVTLRITDDPGLRAFNGRCSLMWVVLES